MADASSMPQVPALHWTSKGRGKPIVLLHGAFTTHTDWPDAITGPASKLGQVIAVDRPGHGQSPRQRHDADARAQARQIEASLGLNQPAIIVAHSFGALVALAYAEQFPEQVAGIMLIAPICFPEWRAEQFFLGPRALPLLGPQISSAANPTIDPAYLKFIQHQMFAPQPVPEEWLASYPVEQILTSDNFVRESEDSWASSPLSFGSYRAARPACPLTVIQGDSDRIIINGWHAQMMHWLAPETRLVWLRNVGHMAHHAAPERVVEELAQLVHA